MAGFCTKCGRPLTDGVPCSCTQSQSSVQPKTYQQTTQQSAYQKPSNQQATYQQPNYQQGAYQQPNYQQGAYQQPNNQQAAYQQPNYQQGAYQQPNFQQGAYQQPNYQQAMGSNTVPNGNAQAGEFFNKFLSAMKELFQTTVKLVQCPYDTTVSILQKNPLMFGIEAIATKAIVNFLVILLFLVYRDSQSMFGVDHKFTTSLTTALTGVVMDLILAGSLFLSTIIFKKQEKFEKSLAVTGIKAILETLIIILTVVFSMVNGVFAAYFFAIASLINFLFLVTAFNLSNSIDNNKKIYAMAVAILITAVALYILFKLFGGSFAGGTGFGGAPFSKNSFY